MADRMLEQQFETVFKPKSPLREVVPYRDGIVTIDANLERLRLDFLEEAQHRKGVNALSAQEIANRLKVFLDPDDYFQYISSKKTLAPSVTQIESQQLLGSIKQTLSNLFPRQTLGITSGGVNTPAVLLNSKNIVSSAKVPDDASIEAGEAAIIDTFHQVWRHEREHLLRKIDPNAIEEDQHVRQLNARVELVTHGAISLASVLTMPDIPSLAAGDPKTIAYLGYWIVMSAASHLVTAKKLPKTLAYRLWSKAEKSARSQEARKNLPSLFEFQFEK